MMLGAIEAGGTWINLGRGTAEAEIRETARVPTTDPESTLHTIIEWFRDRPVTAIGLGSFGPIRLDPAAPDRGTLLSTPKPGWSGFPLVSRLEAALSCPVRVETDVNAALLGEARSGAGRGCSDLVYITVGTGIGGGAMVGGRLVHGRLHPEMGHLRPPLASSFAGVCPFHGDCLEGLASGPAIHARWGQPAETLPIDHPAWAEEARLLGWLSHAISSILFPERIMLGGGVMGAPGLLERVQGEFDHLEGGYRRGLQGSDLIVAPAHPGRSALLGALVLASSIP